MAALRPLFARVLLAREKFEKVGGIIIPDDAQKRHATTKCNVIATGPTCDESIQIGMSVLIGKYAGDWINVDGKAVALPDDAEFYIVQDEDILAIVELEQ